MTTTGTGRPLRLTSVNRQKIIGLQKSQTPIADIAKIVDLSYSTVKNFVNKNTSKKLSATNVLKGGGGRERVSFHVSKDIKEKVDNFIKKYYIKRSIGIEILLQKGIEEINKIE